MESGQTKIELEHGADSLLERDSYLGLGFIVQLQVPLVLQ